jgi:hypothetical protein
MNGSCIVTPSKEEEVAAEVLSLTYQMRELKDDEKDIFHAQE